MPGVLVESTAVSQPLLNATGLDGLARRMVDPVPSSPPQAWNLTTIIFSNTHGALHVRPLVPGKVGWMPA